MGPFFFAGCVPFWRCTDSKRSCIQRGVDLFEELSLAKLRELDGKFTSESAEKNELSEEFDASSYEEFSLKCTDIPLPLGASINLSKSLHSYDGRSVVCVYEVSLSTLRQLGYFYTQEMERHGWKESGDFVFGTELLKIFEKPQKLCALSIRFKSTKTELIIFVKINNKGLM